MSNTIKCPYCGEEIPASSTSCPYCGERLDQKRGEEQVPVTTSPEDSTSRPASQYIQSHIPESDSKHDISPEAGSERQETFKVGKLAAIIIAASVVMGVAVGLAIGTSNRSGAAHKDSISSKAQSPVQPSQSAKAPAPSTTPVSSEATFYCANTKEEVAFDYGYEPYTFGDHILLSGDSGALGRYSGYNVVSYKKTSGTYNYVCFGAEVIVYPPLVISLGRRIVKEGDCEADNEYSYVYEYYSGITNKQMTSYVYSGTIGKYKITMELAFDSETPKAVGTYYYNRNGGRNRMIVFGDVRGDGTLVLKAYDTKFYDKPSETMVLTAVGSGFSGYWERPNKNRLDVNLSR